MFSEKVSELKVVIYKQMGYGCGRKGAVQRMAQWKGRLKREANQRINGAWTRRRKIRLAEQARHLELSRSPIGTDNPGR